MSHAYYRLTNVITTQKKEFVLKKMGLKAVFCFWCLTVSDLGSSSNTRTVDNSMSK